MTKKTKRKEKEVAEFVEYFERWERHIKGELEPPKKDRANSSHED